MDELFEHATSSARFVLESQSDLALTFGWLGEIVLPPFARVEYADLIWRGDFAVTYGDESVIAVCDFETGEFVVSVDLGVSNPAMQFLLTVLRARLRHLEKTPSAARRAGEGRLKTLADIMGGKWLPYETIDAL